MIANNNVLVLRWIPFLWLILFRLANIIVINAADLILATITIFIVTAIVIMSATGHKVLV